MKNTLKIIICAIFVYCLIINCTYAQVSNVTYDDYLNNITFFESEDGDQGLHIFNDRNVGPGVYLLESADGDIKMGIGTSNPEYHFTNVGTTLCKEVSIEEFHISEVPDYVFEDDYNLMPLTELEQFIDENKHLPEIASEKEMQKDGMKLGDMGLKLLLKIEELTLHSIEQNKLIDQLEKELLELTN